MRSAALQRGPDFLTPARTGAPYFERRFQLLALGVSIATDCPELNSQLDYLVQDAQQDVRVRESVRFTAIRQSSLYRVCQDDREIGIERGLTPTLELVYRSCYARANATMSPGTVLLHGACGSASGRRFLLIGESGTGKTTLILHLSRLGALVEGDELAVVTPDGVAALPRRLHVKSDSLPYLPWLAASAQGMPFQEDWDGSKIIALSPRSLGLDWHIRSTSIDAVFHLEANHGGQTRVQEIPRHRMVELVISQARLPYARDRTWLGPLCQMVNASETYSLTVGDLDKTAGLLLMKIEGLPRPAQA